MKNKFIKVNSYTRPGYKLKDVRGIVLHYTANPGASAENHFNFFNNGGGGRYAGAHIFIDRKEALLLVPLNEVCYHANEKTCKIQKLKATAVIGGKVRQWDANLTTIGIEMCIEKDGTIHPETIARTVKVVGDLMKQFKLTVNDLYRHYDVTAKSCPAPWVKAPVEWSRFKAQVVDSLTPAKVETKPVTPTVSTGILTVKKWKPAKDKLNLREKPDLKSKVMQQVNQGTSWKASVHDKNWFKVGKYYAYNNQDYVSYKANK